MIEEMDDAEHWAGLLQPENRYEEVRVENQPEPRERCLRGLRAWVSDELSRRLKRKQGKGSRSERSTGGWGNGKISKPERPAGKDQDPDQGQNPASRESKEKDGGKTAKGENSKWGNKYGIG